MMIQRGTPGTENWSEGFWRELEAAARDPRYDTLPEDSALWVQLLEMARVDADQQEGLYATLTLLRASGCRLEKAGEAYRIDPGVEWDDDPQGTPYEVYRDRYLTPRRDDLVAMLRSLGQGVTEGRGVEAA